MLTQVLFERRWRIAVDFPIQQFIHLYFTDSGRSTFWQQKPNRSVSCEDAHLTYLCGSPLSVLLEVCEPGHSRVFLRLLPSSSWQGSSWVRAGLLGQACWGSSPLCVPPAQESAWRSLLTLPSFSAQMGSKTFHLRLWSKPKLGRTKHNTRF